MRVRRTQGARVAPPVGPEADPTRAVAAGPGEEVRRIALAGGVVPGVPPTPGRSPLRDARMASESALLMSLRPFVVLRPALARALASTGAGIIAFWTAAAASI